MNTKWIVIVILALLPLLVSFHFAQEGIPVAITSGKSKFHANDKEIILETAFKRRPTLSQGPVILVADTMIYDEEKEIGYAYGNLRFADIQNRSFFSAQEGTYFTKEKKIVLRKTPEILMEQNNQKSTRINGKVITIYPEDSYLIVQGNIEIDDGTTFITGKEVRIWSEDNRMIVSGNVQSISEDQKLQTDRLNVQFTNGGLSHYMAKGHTIAVSTSDNFTLCSKLLTFNNEKKLFRATEDPSIYFHEQETMSFANVIEYYQDTKMGNLLGNVISMQGDGTQKAFSRWALYNGSNNTIRMFGNPRLQQEDSELFGMEILVNIDSNNMFISGSGKGFFNRN